MPMKENFQLWYAMSRVDAMQGKCQSDPVQRGWGVERTGYRGNGCRRNRVPE